MLDNDVSDAHVVEDALAFIDAFYASDMIEDSALAEAAPSDSRTEGLCLALRDLQHQLESLRLETTDPGDSLALPLAVDDAHEVQRRLYECQRLCSQVLRLPNMWRFDVVHDAPVAGLLRRRLDEIVSFVARGMSERPLLERRPGLEEVSDKYFDDPASGAAFRFRGWGYAAFKPSVTAKAAWNTAVDSVYSHSGHIPVRLYEDTDDLLVQYRDAGDATEGLTNLRRVYLSDGSVLICWTTVSVALHDDVHPPLAWIGDAEIHQFGWARVGRTTDDTSRRPRVYIESVADVAIRPVGGSLSQEERTRRFQRYEAIMQKRTEWGRKTNQFFENQLLDVSRRTAAQRGTI